MAGELSREQVVDDEMPGLCERFAAMTGHPCAVLLIVVDARGESVVGNVDPAMMLTMLTEAMDQVQGKPQHVWTPPATAKH